MTNSLPNIPLVDLRANYARVKDEISNEWEDVLANTAYIGGKQVSKFEEQFADFIGVKHCVGLNSGTDALFLALKFLDIGPGDEVITQANTFIATCLGISNNGATVVLIDADPATGQMCVEEIEAAITPNTKAVLPVHLYGHAANMGQIMEVAKKHNLRVIEDASQAHGARFEGKRVGSFGDVSCFSMYPGKNLGAYGDGGALCTNDAELATRVRWWQSWGAKKKYHHEIKGGNSRLDGLQAAVLNVKLKYIDDWNADRRMLADRYTELIRALNIPDVQVPTVPKGSTSVWHLYVVRTTKRDELLAYLNKNGIGAGIHYPIAIPELGAYEELKHYQSKCPKSISASKEMISLPMFPELTEEQQVRIVNTIKDFFSG